MLTRTTCKKEDSPALYAFLERHTETSLFLLGNLKAHEVDDNAAVYVIAKDDSRVVGVVSLTAAGFVLVQAPDDAPDLAALAVRGAATRVRGLLGPTSQISNILDGLALRSAPVRMHSDELIYDLNLKTFEDATRFGAHVRLATGSDVDTLTAYRRAYLIEALGAVDDDQLDATARHEAERMSGDGATFVLVERDEIAAMTLFSARYEKVVQVGGVFTPRERRGRGFGRRVIAGSLRYAKREWGSERAVLFTAEQNIAAQRAYEALGFVRNGKFTLHFFREPISFSGSIE